MSGLANAINLFDLEQAAQECMPALAWDYVAGGAEDEFSIVENRRGFQRMKLRPRVLTGVREPDLSTSILGQPVSLPVLIAPTTPLRIVHPLAERAMVSAAGAEQTIAVVGTDSQFDLPELIERAPQRLWFQLYTYGDRDVITRLIQKAERSGCRALVITVDTVRAARRERNLRNRFVVPPYVETPVLLGIGLDDQQIADPANSRRYLDSIPTVMLTWDDLTWIRAATSLPILLKGIMTAEDAVLAVEHGIDGILVSNHGGRQVDGTAATIDVLPEITAAVGGRIEILLDGGVRRGTDVLKALALGASAVLIGRPAVWGLAVGGEAGVRRVLQMLRDEIENAMVQLGLGSIADIGPGLVWRPTDL